MLDLLPQNAASQMRSSGGKPNVAPADQQFNEGKPAALCNAPVKNLRDGLAVVLKNDFVDVDFRKPRVSIMH